MERERSRARLRQLAETYWAESIIPIQGRIAELTAQIQNETVREVRYRLKERRAVLRRMRNELERTAVYLEHYYREEQHEDGICAEDTQIFTVEVRRI